MFEQTNPCFLPAPFLAQWYSLRAQLAKNLTAMEEIPVRSLGGEDPLEKGISLLLRSFNGPEPGGPESTDKKVK